MLPVLKKSLLVLLTVLPLATAVHADFSTNTYVRDDGRRGEARHDQGRRDANRFEDNRNDARRASNYRDDSVNNIRREEFRREGFSNNGAINGVPSNPVVVPNPNPTTVVVPNQNPTTVVVPNNSNYPSNVNTSRNSKLTNPNPTSGRNGPGQ